MDSVTGIGALGLNGWALLFQVINFAILLGLLRAFAYKPIVAILEERRRRIQESLQNAADTAATRTQLERDKQTVMATARAQAQRIVAQGKARSAGIIAAAEQAASERAALLLTQAHAQIEHDVAQVRRGLRQETVQLVAAATEKVIDLKLDPAADRAFITKVVKEAAAA